MLKAGIVGFGVMGKKHFQCYQMMPDVQVVAICETNKIKKDDTTHAAANVGKKDAELDLDNVKLYKDYHQMLVDEELDLVSITVPTFMHADFTTKALKAGLHVLCEKPMALTLEECRLMMTEAEKSCRVLQIAHCIRFWPEYVKTKEIIDSGRYGKVKAAAFQRLSSFPTWGWKNWQQNGEKNGGAMMDLHIHDTDIILHWFGLPSSVFCSATKGPSGSFDHINTHYTYADDKTVVAEASWLMAPSYGFKMAFTVLLENATIIFDSTSNPTLKILTCGNETFTLPSQQKDGYLHQIEYFIKTIRGEQPLEIISPQQAYDTVRIALAEKTSATERKPVDLESLVFNNY